MNVLSKMPGPKNRDREKLSNSDEINSIKEVPLKDLEDKLQAKIGSRVHIKFLDGKGHIKIDYVSLDEFEKIYNVLFSYFSKQNYKR